MSQGAHTFRTFSPHFPSHTPKVAVGGTAARFCSARAPHWGDSGIAMVLAGGRDVNGSSCNLGSSRCGVPRWRKRDRNWWLAPVWIEVFSFAELGPLPLVRDVRGRSPWCEYMALRGGGQRGDAYQTPEKRSARHLAPARALEPPRKGLQRGRRSSGS